MAKIDDLKGLLAEKYGKEEDDIEGTTLIAAIVTDKNLATHVRDKFNKEISTSDLENLTDINSLVNLL
ncbi:hypothetical protein P5705_18235 [Pseudomonas entomophila]|uniref:hypothetical protein n=1 Tax=Pseudomonas entomophila TaxID=312306 RepID=UPI002404AC60|nr:hypothetical protein [Pseudomonas entomophila]MDF9619589.1 hypothetical protein [Pseudomonas entomophila]